MIKTASDIADIVLWKHAAEVEKEEAKEPSKGVGGMNKHVASGLGAAALGPLGFGGVQLWDWLKHRKPKEKKEESACGAKEAEYPYGQQQYYDDSQAVAAEGQGQNADLIRKGMIGGAGVAGGAAAGYGAHLFQNRGAGAAASAAAEAAAPAASGLSKYLKGKYLIPAAAGAAGMAAAGYGASKLLPKQQQPQYAPEEEYYPEEQQQEYYPQEQQQQQQQQQPDPQEAQQQQQYLQQQYLQQQQQAQQQQQQQQQAPQQQQYYPRYS